MRAKSIRRRDGVVAFARQDLKAVSLGLNVDLAIRAIELGIGWRIAGDVLGAQLVAETVAKEVEPSEDAGIDCAEAGAEAGDGTIDNCPGACAGRRVPAAA